MIVVVANRHDTVAHRFASARRDEGVCILRPDDLTQPGWRHRLDDPDGGTFVAGGTILPTRDIDGVLTRLGWVAESELTRIVPSERSYVATEISTFLLSWLSTLPCPLLNRPTPDCLSGRLWRREKWVHVAHRLGIPTDPMRRCIRLGKGPAAPSELSADTFAVTVIGDTHLGSTHPELSQYARALAAEAGLEMLVARFTQRGSRIVFDDVSLWPDLTDERIADAVMRYFSATAGSGTTIARCA